MIVLHSRIRRSATLRHDSVAALYSLIVGIELANVSGRELLWEARKAQNVGIQTRGLSEKLQAKGSKRDFSNENLTKKLSNHFEMALCKPKITRKNQTLFKDATFRGFRGLMSFGENWRKGQKSADESAA